MGEVVETGTGVVKNLRKGDRVVVPFPIACGHCDLPAASCISLCENSNPNAWMGEQMYGYTPCGIFGYSHIMGGYAGGQAEYVRVPFADVGPLKVPDELSDEQVLFLSDIFPTGLHGRGDLRHPPRRRRSRSGAAARSGSSRSRAPTCSARRR